MVALHIEQLNMFGAPEAVKIKRPKRNTQRPQSERTTVGAFLHLGAGWQSSALVEMMIEGVIPRVDVVIFADTGDEPYWVYKQVWYLAERLNTVGIPLIITDDNSGLTLKQQIMSPEYKFANLPLFIKNLKTGKIGRMNRQCTKNRKIDPCKGVILDWLIKNGHALRVIDKNGKVSRRVKPTVKVEDLYGISVDELYRAGRRGGNWRQATYPLIEKRLSRSDCGKWLQEHGLPVPRKSSCKYCPFHEDEVWLEMSIEDPEIFEECCQLDDWLRSPEGKKKLKHIRGELYLHKSCKPLREIDFAALVAAKRNRTLPMFEGEICGDFCMT